MKRNFDVALCARGRGLFKSGCAYAMIKTTPVEAFIFTKTRYGIGSASAHWVSPAGSHGGGCWKIVTIGDWEGARFVEVKKCKRKVKKHG